jgi:hypothetical protein
MAHFWSIIAAREGLVFQANHSHLLRRLSDWHCTAFPLLCFLFWYGYGLWSSRWRSIGMGILMYYTGKESNNCYDLDVLMVKLH